MIKTQTGHTFYPTLDGAPSGLADLTFHVENLSNVIVVAAVPTQEIEESSYAPDPVGVVAPENAGNYRLVWHSDSEDTSATEMLLVEASSFPTEGLYYTTPDNVREHLDNPDLPDEQIAPMIRKAQYDIDAAVGAWEPFADTGLKFASAEQDVGLTPLQERLLSRATCQQIEYRATVGEDFMTREQYESESGPDGGVTGKVKKVSSFVYATLGSADLLRLNTGRVVNFGRHNRRRLPLA